MKSDPKKGAKLALHYIVTYWLRRSCTDEECVACLHPKAEWIQNLAVPPLSTAIAWLLKERTPNLP